MQDKQHTGGVGMSLTPCCCYCCCCCRVMAATYGPDWEHPTTGYHGESLFPRDEASLKEALLEKLSTTAWGDTPWQERKKACGL